MKKIIIISISILTALMIISFIIFTVKGNKMGKGLSVKELHNYSMGNDERKVNQVLYFNSDNIFNNKDIITSIYYSNLDESKYLKLKVNNVKKTGYMHKYKNDKYYSYNYDLTIPMLSNDFEIDDCYLIINSNDKKFKINIGALSIKYSELLGEKENLSLNAIEGKSLYKPYQTLSYINIDLLNKTNNNITINSINMGKYVDLVTDEKEELITNSTNNILNTPIIGYMSNKFKLSLSYKEKYVLSKSYLIVNYSDIDGEHSELIDMFNFYDNGYALPEDELLIYEVKM